jgi:hypothetical protein
MQLAWRAYRRRFLPLAALFCGLYTAAAAIPIFLKFDIDDSLVIAVAIIVWIVIPSTFGALANMIATPVIVDHFAGSETSVRESIRSVAPRLRVVWGTLMLNAALSVLLGLSLRMYAIILLPLFYGFLIYTPYLHGPPLLAQIVAAEEVTFGRALRRFRELIRGYGLRIFMYLMTPALVLGMITLFVLASLVQSTPEDAGLPVLYSIVIAQGVAMGLGAAFLSCAQAVCYLGLRAEREDLTLEALILERAAVRAGLAEPRQD